MKKVILFLSITLTVLLVNINANAENVKVKDLSKEKVESNILSSDSFINSININFVAQGSCTVTMTGSIGWNSTYIEVSVSATAETCEAALNQCVGAFRAAQALISTL